MGMQEVFSRIPMPTWGWLGVNDLPMPKHLGDTQRLSFSCAAGECKKHIVELRDSGVQEICVEIADGAEMDLTFIQFVPTEQSAASRITAEVGRQGLFSCTIVEVGAAHTASELHVNLAGDEARADVWGLCTKPSEAKEEMEAFARAHRVMFHARRDGIQMQTYRYVGRCLIGV